MLWNSQWMSLVESKSFGISLCLFSINAQFKSFERTPEQRWPADPRPKQYQNYKNSTDWLCPNTKSVSPDFNIRYNSARKDNDFIYHESVPNLDMLAGVKGIENSHLFIRMINIKSLIAVHLSAVQVPLWWNPCLWPQLIQASLVLTSSLNLFPWQPMKLPPFTGQKSL